MAKKRVRSAEGGADKRPRQPSALAELLAQLDRMKQDPTASEVRLRSDLARDSAEELFSKMRRQLRKQAGLLRKLQERSQRWRSRLTELLHELTTGPVVLPAVPGGTPVKQDELTVTFRKLKTHDVPGLAQAIHAAAGAGELPAYQRFLVEEIVVKGSRIVAEHLIRLASAPVGRTGEEEFLGRLRHHVAGNVSRGLARQVNYKTTPETGQHLDAVIGAVLRLLNDLLTATPPGRLLLPLDGGPFDPQRHEPLAGRPTTGELKVKATLFPGYVILAEPPVVVEKALVYTDRAEQEPGA
jgi:hypothetical protein